MKKDKIYFFDTTLRDGEQVPGCQLNKNEKIQVAKKLEELGVDVIEAGFPISSPGDFQSVIEISKVVKNITVCALTRAVKKDIEVAADALKNARRGRIHTGIGTSPYHIKSKFQSNPEAIIERAVAAVKYAKKFVEDVEFYAEDAGRTDEKYLSQVIEAVIKAGATVVNIPDTTGYCLPEDYGNKIKYLVENVPNIHKAIISTHCHNDLGMATANTIAGILNGARQVEVTINGIGERAGNTSLEEVAMVIKSHKNIPLQSDINPKKIIETSHLVSILMNMPIQANKAIVGRNAFSHSSGIHQDGVLKNRENYEIIDPKEVGAEKSEIILTARSGKAALNHHLERVGYQLDKEELSKVYQNFLEIADEKKIITDDDLVLLMTNTNGAAITRGKKSIEIETLKIISNLKGKSQAEIKLNYKSKIMEATSDGVGPIDAAFSAIQKIIPYKVTLEELLIQAISGGTEGTGKIHVKIKCENSIYYGFASDTNILTASVQSFLDAISKIM